MTDILLINDGTERLKSCDAFKDEVACIIQEESPMYQLAACCFGEGYELLT